MPDLRPFRTYNIKDDVLPSLVKALQEWIEVELIERYSDFDDLLTEKTAKKLAEEIVDRFLDGYGVRDA